MITQTQKRKIKFYVFLAFILAVFSHYYIIEYGTPQRDHLLPSFLISLIVCYGGLFALFFYSYKIKDFSLIAMKWVSQLLVLIIMLSFTKIMFHQCIAVTSYLFIYLGIGLAFLFWTIALAFDLVGYYQLNKQTINHLLSPQTALGNNLKIQSSL